MKKTILLWLLSLVFITACSPKEAPGASTVQTNTLQANKHQDNPIAKLGFLVGNWAGPGVSFASDGSESHYHDKEYVRFDLDQSLLLINARGESQVGVPSYQLHTVINYDKDAGHYWYTPYSNKGSKASSFSCNLVEQKFLCLSEDKSFRLTFQRLEDGKWNEFGERLSDGKWRKTFETILSPADETIARTPVNQTKIEVSSDFPYAFTAPESWRSEVVTFPLSFAPELDYEGHGDVRFAPGMFTTGAEDFWTYSFVWWLPLDTEITPDRLSADMNAYFSGLANLIMKSREQDVPGYTASAHFEISDNSHPSASRSMSFTGRVETLDAFATQKPVALNAKAELIPCPAQSRLALIFGFSPQPLSHENWNALNKIKAGFQCGAE